MYLSIITINYNNKDGLQKTIDSIKIQKTSFFEHIIIDGGSTDDSKEVIEKYASDEHAYSIKWISEKDSGIYNAMNKGIKMATGDYVQFLNSGDCLYSNDVFEKMFEALQQFSFPPILLGNMVKELNNGKRLLDKSFKYDSITMLTFYQGTLNHSSAYIKRDLFEKYGLYDEALKIVSDWKWYLEVVGLNNVKVQLVDIDVTLFDMTGLSETNVTLCQRERRQVLESLLSLKILEDYDRWAKAINQKKRIEHYPLIDRFFLLIERCLFKWEKHFTNKKNVF